LHLPIRDLNKKGNTAYLYTIPGATSQDAQKAACCMARLPADEKSE
jgi:hypothetical protein